jgi:DNA replication and repair protein RecF
MSIIKGPPQERRGFLDNDISQISLPYAKDSHKYRRILAQRNALLKKLGPLPVPLNEKKEKLSVWEQQLIFYGGRIIEKRIAIIEKLTPLVRLIHRKLTNHEEKMEIRYNFVSGHISDSLNEIRESSFENDLRLGSTQWGPHRDDIKISLAGADIRQYGSQGQQRTGVLALKLAELEIFRGESGEYPLLLLDDVMSELDENRQLKLLDFINEKNIQCIITSTENNKNKFTDKRQTRQFFVNKGEISV